MSIVCGFENPQEFFGCIGIAKTWLGIAFDLLGLGTFALIAILIWLFKRLRRDVENWESRVTEKQKEIDQTREEKRLAEARAINAERMSAMAEQLPAQLRGENEALKEIIAQQADDLRTNAADLASQVSALQATIQSALNYTEYQGSGSDSSGFWSRHTELTTEYTTSIANSIPVLLFGNQKGGVAKTMTVANLAAAFAKQGERVLVIDLDYQGSVSSLLKLEERRQKNVVMGVDTRSSNVDHLFAASLNPNWHDQLIVEINQNLHYIPAYYSFEVVERSVEYKWTLGITDDDVRYRLWKVISSSYIQEQYDRVLLDAPPRFTLGFVSGLCAATHVFVPMIVDQVTADAVEYFSVQFKKLSPVINPLIKFNGITGTVKHGNATNSLPNTVKPIVDELESKVKAILSLGGSLFIRNAVLKLHSAITEGVESGIPYCVSLDLQPMYDQLAAAIGERAPVKVGNEGKRTKEAA